MKFESCDDRLQDCHTGSPEANGHGAAGGRAVLPIMPGAN
jgi:hypothetical protein